MILAFPSPLCAKVGTHRFFNDTIIIRQISLPEKIRAGQHIEALVTVSNKGAGEFSGSLALDIRDSSNKPVDGWFRNIFPVQYFTVTALSEEIIRFPFDIPHVYSGNAALYLEAFDLKGNSVSKKEKTFRIRGKGKGMRDSKLKLHSNDQ
jgi:hypothetical protein